MGRKDTAAGTAGRGASGRSARRSTIRRTHGELDEAELSAMVDAQFPDPPRRRRKKKASAKKTAKKKATRKKTTRKKAAKKTARKKAPAKKKTARKKAPAKKKTARAQVTRKREAAPEPTPPPAEVAAGAASDPSPPPGEPFAALRQLAEASADPDQAEQLWGDEVLGLLRHAAQGLAAEVEQAASAHADALAVRARQRASSAAPAAEREPAFLQLLPDDLDDEDAPLEVFDADALGEEIVGWDQRTPVGPPRRRSPPPHHVPVSKPAAAAPRTATVPPDPVEWNAMVDYLAKGRAAARAARAARRLQKRAAATVLEFAPAHRHRRELALTDVAMVGLLLVGWAATFYARTGDLRVAIGMLSWASCVGCALALLHRRL